VTDAGCGSWIIRKYAALRQRPAGNFAGTLVEHGEGRVLRAIVQARSVKKSGQVVFELPRSGNGVLLAAIAQPHPSAAISA
jgi:hypothetical protein